MTAKYYKQASRAEWYQDLPDDRNLSLEQIQLGAILRIADAVELVAKNHDQLVRDRDWNRGRAERAEARERALRLSNAALRGVISRMKRKAITP